MIGFGANRRGGRIPSFILIFLLVVIAVLAFNYWTVSSRHGHLLDELLEVQTQAKRSDAARSRLEKRNSELMVQVDTHRKQIDQKDGDYSVLEGKLLAREELHKKCADEKMKLQDQVAAQTTEVQRLKEQLKEMKQEYLKQEDELREVKRNRTSLEKKMEYESLQCVSQMEQLKVEFEESKKLLEEEVSRIKLAGRNGQNDVAGGGKNAAAAVENAAGERHTVAPHRHGRQPVLKEELGKPGSDAGMPGIEDSEVGKMDEVQFALKKPAITRKQNEVPGAAAGGADLLLDQPRLQQDRAEGRMAGNGPPGVHKQPERPVVFEDKVSIKADELGEEQRQIQVPDDVKGDSRYLKRIPVGHDDVQVPKPIQPHRAKEPLPAEGLPHRQSRFFDENESPVDPQHGSKLADYNGDDGNVGEYEADKQAELAYNEEEDGDGGEEDVQDDEDRDIQERDRAVDYGKRHQKNDIL